LLKFLPIGQQPKTSKSGFGDRHHLKDRSLKFIIFKKPFRYWILKSFGEIRTLRAKL